MTEIRKIVNTKNILFFALGIVLVGIYRVIIPVPYRYVIDIVTGLSLGFLIGRNSR